MTNSKWDNGDFQDPDMREAYREARVFDETYQETREIARRKFNDENRHFWPRWIREACKKLFKEETPSGKGEG